MVFFFHPPLPVIFVCWVEIKMAFWEKLSCQWLHCLNRIVVINFTRTCSTGALSWRRGVWAAEPGPAFTLLSAQIDSVFFIHRTREGKMEKCLVWRLVRLFFFLLKHTVWTSVRNQIFLVSSYCSLRWNNWGKYHKQPSFQWSFLKPAKLKYNKMWYDR